MTINVGDQLPEANFKVMTDEGPADMSTNDLFSGKKVIVFAVPGAFTPTCSSNHLPRYDALYEEFKAECIDEIMCISVNDAFVMFQ